MGIFDRFKRKKRGFAVVESWARDTPACIDVTLPARSTRGSAGYDFVSLISTVIRPGETVNFPTDVKAYMMPDEVLKMYPRSSQGIKHNLMLANTAGIIDSDYYGNEDNDGCISIYLRNLGDKSYHVRKGDKIAQGIFVKFLLADDDNKTLPVRLGGTGSTGR